MAKAKAKAMAALAKALGVPAGGIAGNLAWLGFGKAKAKSSGKAKGKPTCPAPPALGAGLPPPRMGGLAAALGFPGLPVPRPIGSHLGIGFLPVVVAKGKGNPKAKAPAAPPAGAGPGVLNLGGGGASGKLPADLWVDTIAQPHQLSTVLEAGDPLEIATRDPTTCTVNGAWLMEVT